MRYVVEKNGIDIGIAWKFHGEVKGFPNCQNDESLHYAYDIALASKGGSETFAYFASAYDHGAGKKTLDDDDLKNAFWCIVDDALSGAVPFDEFCGEMGYDEDSRRAERIWQQCQETFEKMKTIGLSKDDLYAISESLNLE
jgi:hypothetical protein